MPLRLNAEKDGKAVAAKYKVNGFPTILFVDGTGKVVHSILGYMPPMDFAGQMELANMANNLPALQRQVQSHPDDKKTLSSLISIYASQKKEPEMLSSLATFRVGMGPSPSTLSSKTLSSVGDYYQNNNKAKQAIPYFEEAAKYADDPHDLAYALISLAGCDLAVGDKKAAIPVLERFLALGPAAKDYEAAAKSMLEAAKK